MNNSPPWLSFFWKLICLSDSFESSKREEFTPDERDEFRAITLKIQEKKKAVPLPMVELLPSLFLWSSYFRPSISSISLSYPNRIIALKEAHIALSLHSVKNNDFCHRKNKKSSHIHRSNCLWANSLLESSLWFGPTPKRELMSSLA